MTAVSSCSSSPRQGRQTPLLPTLDKSVNPVVTKAREKNEYVEKLKRDIFKVDRSHRRDRAADRQEPQRARTCPICSSAWPSSTWRRAATCTSSRWSSAAGDNKGAIVSPETKLLKQKAVQIYNRLLREFPDFHDADKVTFYLAHESASSVSSTRC